MDEPTAALADHEVELSTRSSSGSPPAASRSSTSRTGSRRSSTSATTITVLKDGRQVTTRPAAELDDAELVRLMVGRPISSFFPDKLEGTEVGEVRLRAAHGAGNGVRRRGRPRRSAPARSSASPGCRAPGAPSCSRRSSACTPVHPRHDAARRPPRHGRAAPRQAVRAGSPWSPRTARPQGLALNQSILDNALGVVRAVFPRRTGAARRERAGRCSRRSRSPPAALDQEVQFLSGGNQQKVVLARWLAHRAAGRADGRAHPRHRRRRQARDLRADAPARRARASPC